MLRSFFLQDQTDFISIDQDSKLAKRGKTLYKQ